MSGLSNKHTLEYSGHTWELISLRLTYDFTPIRFWKQVSAQSNCVCYLATINEVIPGKWRVISEFSFENTQVDDMVNVETCWNTLKKEHNL